MAIKFLSDQLFPTDIFLVDVSAGRVGIGTTTPSQKLEVGLGLSSGSDGIFVKGEFAGGPSFTASKNPFISLGTSTDAAYTSTIYLGSSATPTDQESKIEFNRSGSSVSRLSIYHKGQGTYREHLRFGNPSSSTATSVFFGNVGINEVAPTQKLHVAGNARVTGAYYDSNNSSGTSGQVLSSTATGTDWVTPTTGDITGVTAGTGMTGGGTSGTVTLNVIGGTGITANANDVAINLTEVTLGAGLNANASDSLSLDLSGFIDMTAAMLGTDEFIVLDGGAQRRKAANEIGLSIFLNDSGFTTNTGTITGVARQNRISFGSATQDDITHDEDFTIVQTANEERIKIANGGVQVANMNTTAVAGLAGSLRYRVDGTRSYVDMCMQTGASSYSWVNIVQNSWA